eukprot:PhM_4_TR18016/c0_g1_i7/m.33312
MGVTLGPLSFTSNDATNGLVLGTTASVATYHSVLQTITFTTCPRDGDMTDEYTFAWAYEPDVVSYPSPANGEPHYYFLSSTAKTFSDAVAYCRTSASVFGLQGYLA